LVLPLQMSTPVGLKLAHIAAYIDFVPMVLIGESQRFVFHIPLTRCTLLALVFVQCFTVGFGLSLLFRRWRSHDDAA